MAVSALAARITRAMQAKGFRLDSGPGEVNVVYVEGMNPDGTANENSPNAFKDLRACVVSEGGVWKIVKAWECTTAPGRHFTVQPLNPEGAALIALGQQRVWKVGTHKAGSASAHEALVQTGGEVIVTRDNNKDYKRLGDKTHKGLFGINQHWGYDQPVDDIGSASAGCLVGRTREGHREFMRIVKSDPRYASNNNFVFTSTVLEAADVLTADGTAAVPIVPHVSGATAGQRLRMAATIVDFEARRDGQGRLAVYPLPFGDGGGTYEVAGINDRYHPAEAAKLKTLIEQGRQTEAEQSVHEYLVGYTDVVVPWANGNAGVEFYLRDCAFNRGPTGAALILQRAVGVDRDGIVGSNTRGAVERFTADDLLTRLRAAREAYERDDVGRNESSKFWNGLVNRWNKALAVARAFSTEVTGPDVQPKPQPQDGNQLPLILLLMMLSKEKPMAADPARPGQGIDLGKVLLPLLLQSMLTGKQIDIMELLSALLTGKVPTSMPTPASSPQPSPQQPTDLNALLLPLLYQALTGKPLPGVTPPEPVTPADTSTKTAEPVIQKPSVQLSVAGLGLSTILQALGVVGTPFGMGTDPTPAGTLATIVPIATALLGATGGFGSLLGIGRKLLSGFAAAASAPK